MILNRRYLVSGIVFYFIYGRSLSGGAHIHICVFTDCKNNRFQKKLMMQNMNI